MGANFPGDDLESLNWLPDHTDALQAKHWLPSKWSDFHSWIPYKKKADATNVASEKNHVEFIYFLLVFQKFIYLFIYLFFKSLLRMKFLCSLTSLIIFPDI